MAYQNTINHRPSKEDILFIKDMDSSGIDYTSHISSFDIEKLKKKISYKFEGLVDRSDSIAKANLYKNLKKYISRIDLYNTYDLKKIKTEASALLGDFAHLIRVDVAFKVEF